METTAASTITIAAWPGCTPRLLRDQPGLQTVREDYAAYSDRGGYQPLAAADELLDDVERSGLLGRGGAAFPLAVKLRSVRDNGIRANVGTVLVANGEEGEPASIKDRWLLRNRPHLVLDGLRLAAAIVAADRAHVYVSDPESARSVETALGEIGADTLGGISVAVRVVDPGYIAGEETAAVRALNGGPVKPTDKPPRPFEVGVDGRPTLVSNVETLANLPYIQQHGSTAFREQGIIAVVGYSPGDHHRRRPTAGPLRSPARLANHRTACPARCFQRPGARRPDGRLLRRSAQPRRARCDRGSRNFSTPRQRAGMRCDLGDHRRLPGSGGRVGAGLLRSRKRRAVRLLFQRDRGDGRRCRGVARRCRHRRGSDPAAPLVGVLRGRGACATLDAATNIAASLLDQFPHPVQHHLDNACQTCQLGAFRADRPYEVEAVSHA